MKHGTPSGYRRHKCRCTACKRAHSAALAEYRASSRVREAEQHRNLTMERRRKPLGSWAEHAACRGQTSLMYDQDRWAEALRVCAGCPVRVECLEHAIEQHEDHGIWGGMSERGRRELRRKRKLEAS